MRRVFTKSHHAAAVHLPHNPISPGCILLDSLKSFFTRMLHSRCWILFVRSYISQKSGLIIHLFLQLLKGMSEIFQFRM